MSGPRGWALGMSCVAMDRSFPQASDSPSVKWEPSKHLFHASLSNLFIWMVLASLPGLVKDHSLGGTSPKVCARPPAWASVSLSHGLSRCGLGELGRRQEPRDRAELTQSRPAGCRSG